MRRLRTLALGASMLVLVGACSTGGSSPSLSTAPSASPAASQAASPSPSPAPPAIKIGSDGFYESKLVAEMYAQVLEAAGYTVERDLGLGSRDVSAPALESGQIDLKPEYIGSGLGYSTKQGLTKARPTGDPATHARELQATPTPKGITVLP